MLNLVCNIICQLSQSVTGIAAFQRPYTKIVLSVFVFFMRLQLHLIFRKHVAECRNKDFVAYVDNLRI